MKKRKISKYFKLAAVLLYNVAPIWFLISIAFANDTDFAGLGFLVGLFFLIVFNLWALIVYKLTNQVEKPVLREISFYVLLFLFLYGPAIIWLLSKFFN